MGNTSELYYCNMEEPWEYVQWKKPVTADDKIITRVDGNSLQVDGNDHKLH